MSARAPMAAWVLSLATIAAAQPAPSSIAAADAAMRQGRFDEAARRYEEWVAAHPDASEVLFALGVCYVQLGRPDEAISALERHVRLSPASASGHAALGVALLDGASTAEAARSLDRALALSPSLPNAIEARARIHLVEGEPARAVALLRGHPASGGGGQAQGGELQALLAEALIRGGHPADAASLLEKALAADPNAPAQTYVMAGWAWIEAGDQARAADVCERGMRLHPDSDIESVYLTLPPPVLAQRTAARLAAIGPAPDVRELIALGRVLTDVDPTRQTRAGELSLALLSQAVSLEPANPSARYNYGRALRRTDVAGALAQWERALTLSPGDELRLQIHTQIARAKDAQSDRAAAEAAFEAAMAINRRLPRRVPEAALEYVRFRKVHGQAAQAEALLDEIVGWNPFAPDARVERARLLADGGRWEQVVTEGEFVLRQAAGNPRLVRVAHLLLARAYFRLNQPEKAQAHKQWLESH